MKRKQKKSSATPLIACVRCGEHKAESQFIHNRWSKVYAARKRVPLCIDCIQALFQENTYRYGEKAALFLTCAAVDIPFLPERYKQIADTSPPFTFGKYIKQLNINQYKASSFAISVMGSSNPDMLATGESLIRLKEDIETLREELRNLKAKFG